MTQDEFNKLPMLLLPHQAMRVLGCTEETLKTLRENNPQMAVMLRGMKHRRYIKAVVAELAKLKYP